jgi:hypothetical protein
VVETHHALSEAQKSKKIKKKDAELFALLQSFAFLFSLSTAS